MMKMKSIEKLKNVSLTAALIIAATLTACSNDDNIVDSSSIMTSAKETYTMTVQATKSTGNAETRGLNLDGNTLKVKWDEGEKVDVVQQEDNSPYAFYILGTLTATPDAEDPTKATLSGTLDKVPTHKRNISFYLHSATADYQGQTGVLLSEANSIEKKYDYASAFVRWDRSGEFTVDEENKTVTVPGGLTFESLQSIVKFNLVDKETGNPIKAKTLTISGIRHPGTVDVDNICQSRGYDGSSEKEGPLTITPASPTSEIYAAIRSYYTNTKFTLTAIDENDVKYTYEKTDVTFENGVYYSITVKMSGPKVNLSTLTEDYVAKDGDILMGVLNQKIKVSIADGATVTLNGLTIDGTKGEYGDKYPWAGITCEGDATIILEGENTARGFEEDYPGFYIPTGKTLTITGTGSLDASSNGYGAGIGAGNKIACGDIVIESGTITATGGIGCAGIGSAGSGNCGNITIKGGTIEATGGQGAPGIGAGDQSGCGDITIENTVTKVTAKPGNMSYYSIGLGATSNGCGTITIGGTKYYDGSNFSSDDLKNALMNDTFTWPTP